MNAEFVLRAETTRYADVLESLLRDLDAEKVLYLTFEDDYQGSLDADVLLKDGRVFSYGYSYGSCSGCDEWEDEGQSDDGIKEIMKSSATFFNTQDEYTSWASQAPGRKGVGEKD